MTSLSDAPVRHPVLPLAAAKALLRRPFLTLATIVAAAFVLGAIFAPWIVPWDPTHQDFAAMMSAPGADHWLGTDSYGKDLFSRIVWGSRYALTIGVCSVAIGAFGGLVIGLTAGLSGGVVAWALMRLVDSILALPALIMAIAFISILGQGPDKVILAVGVALIGPFSRVVRADVLQVKAQGFIEAARLTGISPLRIVVRHVLPNVAFPLFIQITLRVGEAILVSSSLSFLGIGVSPPEPDWGLMISEGRAFVSFAPWISGAPGAALSLLLISLSVVGDAVREKYDPKLQTAG